jgi:hypothetical protein
VVSGPGERIPCAIAGAVAITASASIVAIKISFLIMVLLLQVLNEVE